MGGLAAYLAKSSGASKPTPAVDSADAESDQGGPSADDSGQYGDIGAEVRHAIADKDDGALGAALKRLVVQCMAEESD